MIRFARVDIYLVISALRVPFMRSLFSLGLLLGRVAFSYDVYSCPTMFTSGSSECFVDYDLGTSVLRLTSNGLPGHWYDPAGGAAEQLWEQDFPLRPAVTFRPSGECSIHQQSNNCGSYSDIPK